MLADPRSYNLASNFAGQWLGLRTLESFDPNVRLYPDFDRQPLVRRSVRRPSLFVDSILREDRSVRDLIKADYTFLNERLAKHYGIPQVYGSRFGAWRLPPAARAADCSGKEASWRSRRMRRERRRCCVACGSSTTSSALLHRLRRRMSPRSKTRRCPPASRCGNGWALIAPTRRAPAVTERSTLWGLRWRTSTPWAAGGIRMGTVGRLDVSGALPGADAFHGVAGLEEGLLSRPELFAGRLTEKLLTFALDEASSTTMRLRSGGFCATPSLVDTASRRSCWAS